MNKKLITGTLVGLISLGTYLQFERPSRASIVKRKFDSFPTEIPGAKSVKKYGVEGAKYCLVHLRQSHGGSQKQASESEIKAVQNDIYKTLSYLVTHNDVHEVYVEGIYSESNEFINLNQAKLNYDNLNKEIKQVITKEAEYAPVRLFFEDRIKIKPAEKREIYLAAHQLNSITDLFNRCEGRENALLELIAEDNVPLAVTTYGGSHSWTDNIQNWNILHPDKKFSLIEIKPENAPNWGRIKFVKSESGELEAISWKD